MKSSFANAATIDHPYRAFDASLDMAWRALLDLQRPDGHFVFDLETDAGISADYILLRVFLEDRDQALEGRIAAYLRRTQSEQGAWMRLANGRFDLSASVKAYFALKAVGDDPDAPHMARARSAILAHGGAVNVNVFTRITLALHGVVPWYAVPTMPVELMHAPDWFPVNLYRVSYWARVTLAPLLVLMALKPSSRAVCPIDLTELFVDPPATVRSWPKSQNQSGAWGIAFDIGNSALRLTEPFLPRSSRRSAIRKAVEFVRERLNGDDGLGAIFPPMVYTIMMLRVIGRPEDDPDVATAWRALEKLVRLRGDEAFCQPCVSPVWDSALSAHALMETEGPPGNSVAALDWLVARQELDVIGDWAHARSGLRPGGWCFQYANPHYPDLDDTAVVVMALDRARRRDGSTLYDRAIARGLEWVLGMQSLNGGWAAYDADNTATYLNAIPFADHGALLDPPTSDVSARCVAMLGQLGHRSETSEPLRRGLAFLLGEQSESGAWFGRWGMNYVYGTWSVLWAFEAAGMTPSHPSIRRAVDWLERVQNPDGGWGEGDGGYESGAFEYEPAASTPSQTAWALLGLMAAGAAYSAAVSRGIDYLVASQDRDGRWSEETFTGVGFPKVLYLRYGGYSKYFPLWALARYRNLTRGPTDATGSDVPSTALEPTWLAPAAC